MNVDDAKAVARSLIGWSETYHEAAEVLADEVDRLTDELARVTDDYHAQLETVHELNEALTDAFPELDRRHPSHLRPVPPA